MEGCTMRFERLTDLGPKGAQRFWGSCPKTPEQLGAAFAFSRIRIELPPGANDLCDGCAVHSTVCYAIFLALKVPQHSKVKFDGNKRGFTLSALEHLQHFIADDVRIYL